MKFSRISKGEREKVNTISEFELIPPRGGTKGGVLSP
jgi:hypothetical protein